MGKIKYILIVIIALLFTGCATKPKYDYTIHKPKVIYKTPSRVALKKMLPKTHGKKYVWAEEGPKCFDCSGLTYYNYGSMNLWLPRRAVEQAKLGKKVAVDELEYGDLIFFATGHKKGINHVGIYVGDGQFTHASSTGKRVMTTSIHKPYYRQRIVVCKRIIPSSPTLAMNDKVVTKPKTFAMTPPKEPKNIKLTKANVYTADTIVSSKPNTIVSSLY